MAGPDTSRGNRVRRSPFERAAACDVSLRYNPCVRKNCAASRSGEQHPGGVRAGQIEGRRLLVHVPEELVLRRCLARRPAGASGAAASGGSARRFSRGACALDERRVSLTPPAMIASHTHDDPAPTAGRPSGLHDPAAFSFDREMLSDKARIRVLTYVWFELRRALSQVSKVGIGPSCSRAACRASQVRSPGPLDPGPGRPWQRRRRAACGSGYRPAGRTTAQPGAAASEARHDWLRSGLGNRPGGLVGRHPMTQDQTASASERGRTSGTRVKEAPLSLAFGGISFPKSLTVGGAYA